MKDETSTVNPKKPKTEQGKAVPMEEHRKKRDRSGEPFQNTFTENEGAPRKNIEDEQHDLDVDG